MGTHGRRLAGLIVTTWLCLGLTSWAKAGNQPVARWLLSEDHLTNSVVADGIRGYKAQVHGTVDFTTHPFKGIRLDGEDSYLSITEPPKALLPEKTLTVEVWASVNTGQAWGNLISYSQDNGSYEKGWLLGYNNTNFTFSVSTQGKLQYQPSQTAFRAGRWYYVVGTYDGEALRLYVNGKLEASQTLRGTIDYPERAILAIGAYKDDDEFYAMNGSLHEVGIYARALSAEEIKAKYDAKAPDEAEPLELELPPYVQYISPSEAIVRWWTKEPCPSILEYGSAGPDAKFSPRISLFGKHQGNLDTRRKDKRSQKHHAMKIEGLQHNEVYAYRIKVPQGRTVQATEVYELDTALNYAVRPLPKGIELTKDAAHAERMRALAQEILNRTGVTKGYCIVWGLMDGQLAYELAAGSELTVVGLDADPSRVADLRKRLYRAGLYGGRISIQNVDAFDDLPYPSNFANLIVSERMLLENECPGNAAELARLLRPRGGAAVLVGEDGTTRIEEWLNQASIPFQKQQNRTGLFYKITKVALPGIGSWTHQYGDAGNTADSHDELGGVTTTNGLQVQWLGKPGADFGMDRNPRMPAPLAANGRLFHQGMNRMVALDSYNGAILWSLEIPAMQRVNMPRDASNWCTDETFLYTAVQDKCWMIEHYHGRLEHTFTLPAGFPARDYDWGYVARQNEVLLGSAVRKNAIYTEFWGGDAWYDKTSGFGTEKVCSDAVFAYDVQTKAPLWTWRDGVVINTTIAVGKESVFFVESRNAKLRQSPTRRLNNSLLWSDQYLVALNPQTGKLRWERPIDTVDGIVVFFLVSRDDSVVITSSAAGNYNLYAFDAETGRPRWQAEHKWPSDNHGGHMQHPVVLADRVFLEPCGYDLKTGRRITSAMSGREGCATYCGTKYALIHRGQARRVTMWDFNTGQITSWTNLRPSCWLSTVAGEGMVLSPEGGGGCSCGNWLETSLAFAPIVTQGR